MPGIVNANGQYPTVTTPFGLASIGFSNLNGSGSIPTFVTPNVIGSNPVNSWTLPGVLPGQNPGIASVIPGSPGIPPPLPGSNPVGPQSVPIGPNQMGEACGLNQFLGANVNGLTLASASGLPRMNPHGINDPGANFAMQPNLPGANGFQNMANHNEPQNWARQPEPFLPEGGWPQMCEVCSLTIASECQWIAHCKGRKHQKKLLLHNRESWEEDDGYYEQEPIYDDADDEEYIGIDEVTQWRKCTLCKVAFTSWVIEEAHRMGKKHLKKLRAALQAKRQGRSIGAQPVCDLCDVAFNSEEQYHIHINGKKHLRKWLERDTQNPTNKLSAPDNGWRSTASFIGHNQGIPAGLPLQNPIPAGLPRPNAGSTAMLPAPNPRIPAVLSLPKQVESQSGFIGPKPNGKGNELSEPVTKRAKLNPIVDTAEVSTAAVAAPAVPEPIDEDEPEVPLKLEVQADVTRHVVQPQALPSYAEVSKLAKDKATKPPIKKSLNTISTAQNIVVAASPSPRNKIPGKDVAAKTRKVPAALVIEVAKKQPLAINEPKSGPETVNAINVKKESVPSNSKLPEKVTSNSELPQKSSTKKAKDDTSKIVNEKTSNSVKIQKENKKSNSEKDGSKKKDLAVTEKKFTLLPHLAIEKKLDQAFTLYSKTTWGSTKHAEDLYSNYMKLYKDYDVAYAKYIVKFKAKKAMEKKEKKVQ